MLYPTSPPPQRSDQAGPCTVHFYLLTNFFLRMYLMHILCVKPFAVYACSRDQLGGASDSLALRSRDGGLKRFCGYPTLPALSTSFPTGQVNTIGVVYKCACMSTSIVNVPSPLFISVHNYMEFPYIAYMAPIGCMLNVHVVGYGQRLHVWL